MSDVMAQMREWQAKIDALPPRASLIRASHKVPYGRAYRMWDTRGRLIIYANRGEIADLPRAPKSGARFAAFTDPYWMGGIPVVTE